MKTLQRILESIDQKEVADAALKLVQLADRKRDRRGGRIPGAERKAWAVAELAAFLDAKHDWTRTLPGLAGTIAEMIDGPVYKAILSVAVETAYRSLKKQRLVE